MKMTEMQQKELLEALADNLQVSSPELISEEAILKALAKKVAEMLQYNRDVFFQLMYKLDIDEHKLQEALAQQDISYAIAGLIYDRQLQKIISRKTNKPGSGADKELEW